MNPRFVAFAGGLGNVHQGAGARFAPTANPWANVTAGLQKSRPNVRLIRPIAATATIAGRSGIGCCSGCAADHRKA